MRGSLCLSALAVCFLSGCVQNQANYTPPDPYELRSNSRVVDLPKDEAWAKLIAKLGENFFVINNLDKDSGFINVSYTGEPEKYVDGGKLYYMIENLAGKREYSFPAASRYQRYEAFLNGILMGLERTVELEGRMNIVLSKEAQNKTRITVNTRYVIKQSCTGRAATGQLFSPTTETLTFNTGGFATNQAGTVYRATGEFEREILDLLTK